MSSHDEVEEMGDPEFEAWWNGQLGYALRSEWVADLFDDLTPSVREWLEEAFKAGRESAIEKEVYSRVEMWRSEREITKT